MFQSPGMKFSHKILGIRAASRDNQIARLTEVLVASIMVAHAKVQLKFGIDSILFFKVKFSKRNTETMRELSLLSSRAQMVHTCCRKASHETRPIGLCESWRMTLPRLGRSGD